MNEPQITINGIQLSEGQAMTLRVALESFAMDLTKGLGDDETGKKITIGYQRNISIIRRMMQVA
jgi:hypothetical protein